MQNHYCHCKDIPYAAPPLGNLRFAPPVTAADWSCVRDATKTDDKICPQVLWTQLKSKKQLYVVMKGAQSISLSPFNYNSYMLYVCLLAKVQLFS